jgi:hypothetical protein
MTIHRPNPPAVARSVTVDVMRAAHRRAFPPAPARSPYAYIAEGIPRPSRVYEGTTPTPARLKSILTRQGFPGASGRPHQAFKRKHLGLPGPKAASETENRPRVPEHSPS